MKYTVSINQKAVCDAGYDLDLTDMAIFDVLTVFTNSSACKKMSDGAEMYFNVPYQVIINELPLAKIKKTDSVYRRFQKLAQYGIIDMHPENKKMKQVWFAWGRNYLKLHSSLTGFKSGQPETNPMKTKETPILTGFKSGLRPDLNPPHNNTNHYTPNKRGDAHAKILSILEAHTVVNDIAGPGLGDFPTAKTPAELQNELRAFYARFPEEWNFITSETPAKLQTHTQRAECVKDFCAWAIGEGWEKRDFGKINARLIRWFNDEARMKPKAATQSNTPTYSRPAGIKSA